MREEFFQPKNKKGIKTKTKKKRIDGIKKNKNKRRKDKKMAIGKSQEINV